MLKDVFLRDLKSISSLEIQRPYMVIGLLNHWNLICIEKLKNIAKF